MPAFQALIIDDNPGDIRLISELLKESSQTKFEVASFDRLDAGLAYLAREQVDVLLLDLGLPDSQGPETLERVRAAQPALPVVVLTGLDDEETALQALSQGAQDYLVKGTVDGSLLIRIMRYAIERKRGEEALRESQRTLETLMGNLPGMVYRCLNDEKWTMKFVSEGAAALTGYRPADLIDNRGIAYADLIVPEDQAAVMDAVQAGVRSGKPYQMTYRITTAGGEQKWVWEQGEVVRTADDGGLVLEGFITDITERKKLEEALRESEERSRTALYSIGDAVITTNNQGTIRQMNPVAEALTGWSEAEAAGKLLAEVFHIISEETRDRVEDPVERVLEVGAIIGLANHTLLIARDGKEYPIADSGAPIRSEEGEITGVVLVFRDQTEERAAEEALRESEQKYRSLFENMLSGFAYHRIVFDEDGQPVDYIFLDANSAFEQLIGLKRENVIGKRVTEVIPGIEQEGWIGRYGQVALTGQPLRFEQYSEALDRWYWVSAYSPQPEHFVTIFHDITERKKVEQALRTSEERYRVLAENAPVGIWQLTSELHTVYANPAMLSLLQVESLEELPDEPFPAFLSGENLQKVLQEHAKRHTGASSRYEVEMVGQRGQKRNVIISGAPILSPEGELQSTIGLAIDITERVQAEEALRESEARLAAFTDAMPDVGFILDGDGKYLEVVGGQKNLLADRAARLKGHSMHDVLPQDVADKCLAAIRRSLATGEVQSVEYGLNVSAGYRQFEGRILSMGTDIVGTDAAVFLARDITESALAQAAERRQRLLAEALRDTAAMLHSTLELDEVLERILQAVEELLPHRGANIMLFEEGSETVRVAKYCACYDTHGLTQPAAPPRSLIGKVPPFSELARTRQPMISADVREDPNWPVDVPSIQWIRAYLGAPILVNGEVAGFINLESDEVDQYTPDDAEVLAALANQAAIAIDSARLYEQARQQRLLAEALRDTASALHGTLELDEVLDRILEAAEELVPHSGANIILADETSGALKLARYCPCYEANDQLGPQLPKDAQLTTLGVYRDIAQTHEPVIVPDTSERPDWPTYNPSIQWVRSYLCAPILVDEEIAGFINLDSAEVNAFTPDDAEALEALAGQAAVAIDSARLYEDAQRRANELEALRRVTINITTQFDLDALLADLMRSVQELLEVNAAGLYLYRPETDVLEWVIGLGQTKMKVGSILRRGEGLSGKVWETGEPLTVQDYANWEGKADHYDIGSRATILGIPIHWGEETLGVINAGRYGDASYSFSDRDIRLLSLFADQAAIAIRNAQLFDQVEERARYLAALNRASSRVSRWGLDLDGVLQAVVTTLTEEIGIDFARIWLADREDETLEMRASAGRYAHAGRQRAEGELVDRSGRLTQIAQEGKPFLTNRVQEDETFDREWAAEQGVVAFAGYPLKKDRHLMAVLTIFHSQPLAEIVLDVMGSFANQAAIAIENARLYEELETYSGILEQAVAERTADLERAKEQVESILHHSPDGIVLLKPDGAVETANLAALKMLGYGVDELVGEPASTLVDPADANRCSDVLESTRQQRIAQRAELLARRSDDTTFDAQAVLGPIIEDGDVIGIVCSLRDITALKEVERIKDDFLATAAHELRTPLTSIRGFSELLLTRDLSRERQERYHRHINDQSTQLANIIDDLLDISRLEAGRGLDLKLAPVHMSALIEEVVDPFVETMPNHTFRLDLQENRPVKGDAFRLSQVARNLMLNAVKYSPDGGEITIKSRARGDMLEVSVADRGIGITEKQQAHLFEKFYRADPSGTSGTGLGLVICKLIVEGHGGEIRVESQLGEGSTFTFTVPLDV